MAIIDDYGAIARRMRELKAPVPKRTEEITELESWRNGVMDAVRTHIQRRKMQMVRGPLLPRRPQPTD